MKLRKNLKFKIYIIVPFILTCLMFLIVFNLNLDRVESIFYDYAVKYTSYIEDEKNKFVHIEIDHGSNDYLGEVYPYPNKVYYHSLKNIFQSKPKAIVFLPEFSDFNKLDKDFLKKINKLLLKYVENGGRVFLKQKIDSWGFGEAPIEINSNFFHPSVLHQDGNVFGQDKISRRALITFGNKKTLEKYVAESLNEHTKNKNLKGFYFHDAIDASFTLIRFSKKIYSDSGYDKIPFYKTITLGPELNLNEKIVIMGSYFKSNISDNKIIPGKKRISNLELISEIISSLSNDQTIKIVNRNYSLWLSITIALIMLYTVFYLKPARAIICFLGVLILVVFVNLFLLNISGYYFRVSEIFIMGILSFYFSNPFRSILENKRNFALEEEARILKEVDELKRNFVSLMSHDLKTPVAKISSVVELLKMENSDRQIVNELEKIDVSTNQLNDFINSILDLTKMESDNLQLNLKSTDLNKILDKVSSSLIDQLNSRDMKLITSLDVLFPITLDERLTYRVVNNLLENAIKYAGKGCTIKISTRDCGDLIELIIEDNGIGISDREIKYIFEKFYRVKNDEVPGNGLGLYLVKYFVELMDGHIFVTSNIGEGTKFVINFKNS